jgi:iron complex transport system substrate-binding protein
MNLRVLPFVLVLLSLALLAGCRTQSVQGNYTDDLGRKVQIKGIPTKMISLCPSNTEIVYALGLEDKLIGVTTYCNYPEAAKAKPKVSEYSNIDIEKIVSLQPDLILADGIQHKAEVIPAFEKLNIPVLGLAPETLSAIFSNIELLGKVSGETKAAGTLISSLQARIQVISDKLQKANSADSPRVFFVTWHDPLWTAGSGTLINELMTGAGGANIASDLNGHSQIDLETVIQRNPQIIFVMGGMGDQNASLEYIKSEPRFQATDAVKNNRVFLVDSDIFGRTTPRAVDGLEQMAKLTHPELFK